MVGWARATGAMVAAALATAACRSPEAGRGVATLGRSGGEESPSPRASQDPQEGFLAWAECMRDRGVDVGDPATPEGGGQVVEVPIDVPREEIDQANEACQDLLPDEGPDPEFGALSPEEQARAYDQALRFARCMREHGLDFPDPQQGEGGILIEPGEDVDPESLEVQQATEDCGGLLGATEEEGGSPSGGP